MTAIEHLRALTAVPCRAISIDPYANEGHYDVLCHHCGAIWADGKERHLFDCPWIAAKGFVKAYDIAMATGGTGITTNASLAGTGWHTIPISEPILIESIESPEE